MERDKGVLRESEGWFVEAEGRVRATETFRSLEGV